MIKSFKIFSTLLVGLVIVASCFKEDEYDNVKAEGLLAFELESQEVPADGNSSVTIAVRVNGDAIKSRRSVVFKTDRGSFAGGKGDSLIVDAGDDFLANARLVSTKAGSATITASILGYKIASSAPITFTRAYPTAITAHVDSFSISNSYKSEISINAFLQTDKGVPTQGHPVVFSAQTDAGSPIGVFLNGNNTAFTNAEGAAVIRFSAASTNYRGRVSLVATTSKEDGTFISGTTYIYLTD